jgi:hypothetical protein
MDAILRSSFIGHIFVQAQYKLQNSSKFPESFKVPSKFLQLYRKTYNEAAYEDPAGFHFTCYMCAGQNNDLRHRTRPNG